MIEMDDSHTAEVLIYVGGPRTSLVWDVLPQSDVEAAHRQATHIVAVDSGLHLANEVAAAVAKPVTLVIGDLDSVAQHDLDIARQDGAQVTTFPSAKDETDFELALIAVTDLVGPGARVQCVSPSYGRFDHLLAVTHTLTSSTFRDLQLSVWFAQTTAHVVHEGQARRVARSETDDGLISVLPCHGGSRVTMTGTRWELNNEWLGAGTSRGMSNVVDRDHVQISVAEGTVLILLPHNQSTADPSLPRDAFGVGE